MPSWSPWLVVCSFGVVTNPYLVPSLFLLCFSMRTLVPVSPFVCPTSRMNTPIVLSTSSPPLSPHKRIYLSHSHPLSEYSGPITAPPLSSHFAFDFPSSSPLPEDTVAPSSPPGGVSRSTTSPVKVTVPLLHRRSSDSDISNTPPKGR